MSFIEFNFTSSGDNFGFDKEATISITVEIDFFIDYSAYDGRYSLDAIEIENLDVVYFGLITKKQNFLNSFINDKLVAKIKSNEMEQDIWENFSKDDQKNIIERIKFMFDKNQNELFTKLDEAIADQAISEAERRYEEAYERRW